MSSCCKGIPSMHVKMIRLSLTRKTKSKVSADSDMLRKLKICVYFSRFYYLGRTNLGVKDLCCSPPQCCPVSLTVIIEVSKPGMVSSH